VAPVKQVHPREVRTLVYSVEVKGTHTFAATSGIYVHNCIPLDPLYLSWKLKSLNYTARFIELADAINSHMPEYVVTLVADALNEDGKPLRGAKVLILGAAYKPDIDDVRESPALDVMVELLARHALVSYHDPYVPEVRLAERGATLHSEPLTPAALEAADCVLVITHHAVFDWTIIRRYARLIVDTRNALKSTDGGARVVKL
jgi:UDP-N-acetyl-D-glucosamine dehydrogenase